MVVADVAVAYRIVLGDAPAVWEALGFAVSGGALRLGALELALAGTGGGVVRVELDAAAAADGLPLERGDPPRAGPPAVHPNGASAIDHLVALTPDRDRTTARLRAAGADLRRTGEPPSLPARMAFLRFGPLVVEVAETDRVTAPCFWGLTVEVEDLDAVAAQLAGRLGGIRPAVQRGRRIATVRSSAGGPGAAVAMIDRRRDAGAAVR